MAGASSAVAAGEPFAEVNQTYLELLQGVGVWLGDAFRGDLVFGQGVLRAYGAPDWRFGFTLRYEGGRPSGDPDGDGLVGDADKCPTEAEDKDSFEDADGCPDPDNDQDGVLDVTDKCPLDPEDKDSFEDADGCPDPDNDQDGALDVADKCPLEAEDKDGFEDVEGCPDPDNDQDKVLDVADKCLNVPGVVELQGCPDEDQDKDGVPDRLDECPSRPGAAELKGCPKEEKVRVKAGKLEIVDLVYFALDKDIILPKSFPILKQVASVLKENPSLKVRVEGHTDNQGPPERNLNLSKRRAASVVAYLVKEGVAADRLSAEGFGQTRPISSNASPVSRAKNRRVEFVLLGQAAEGTEVKVDATAPPPAEVIEKR
jgi:outer membrane protein OmpA-like peptidoglycan-associated protein